VRDERNSSRKIGRWPLLPVAPAIVAVLGIATAVTIAFVGARQLQRTSDEAAALHSKALAATLAARMRTTPIDQRGGLLARAARRSGAAFLLVDQDGGSIVVDPMLAKLTHGEIMRLLAQAEGTTQTSKGRTRFAASSVSPPLENLSVMAFVTAPSPAEGTIALSNAIGVLTLLLLGVAVAVSLLFMRSAREDVTYVGQRIADLARGGSDASSAAAAGGVPVRSLDQVGLLTAALNALLGRFAAAEHAYRVDLNAAAQLDHERSQFLAGLSHELRTPLNAILGFTHLLESEDEGPLNDDSKEALAMIRTSGEHLKALIDDILDLSAMETGQLRLQRQTVNVHALAREVVREARATIHDRPLVLRVDGDPDAKAWADPLRLRQVLTNLVSNALKATARGEVCIHVARREASIAITVRDSGRGIAPEVLRAIFEPYKQAGDAAARRGGAGLGLAIARRLVLLHGGSISAMSELGRGAVFTVTVPDDSHAATMPRDSLVPWSETPSQSSLAPQAARQPSELPRARRS
jgi:signal transduction histidine kinase